VDWRRHRGLGGADRTGSTALIPLAVLLDSPTLRARADHWVACILASQQADGWLGPIHDARFGYPHDPWPLFIVLKALTQYHEATVDTRIPLAMVRLFRRLDGLLAEWPLRSWARLPLG